MLLCQLDFDILIVNDERTSAKVSRYQVVLQGLSSRDWIIHVVIHVSPRHWVVLTHNDEVPLLQVAWVVVVVRQASLGLLNSVLSTRVVA